MPLPKKSIFGPDRKCEQEGDRYDWPVVRIAWGDAVTRWRLVLFVQGPFNEFDYTANLPQHREPPGRIQAAMFANQGNVFFGVPEASVGCVEAGFILIAFDDCRTRFPNTARTRMLASSTSPRRSITCAQRDATA